MISVLFFVSKVGLPPRAPVFPYTTLFRSRARRQRRDERRRRAHVRDPARAHGARSEEHTSELQSRFDLVCRLLLEKKKLEKTAKRSSFWSWLWHMLTSLMPL